MCDQTHTPLRVKVDGVMLLTQLTPVLPVTWPARWNGRGGLLKMLVRNCFSMLGVAHRRQRVLVISDTTRVSLISQAERRTLSSYDINTLMHCINPKPVAKYRRSTCSALGKLGDHYPGADGREREREQTHFLRSCNGSTPPTPAMCDLRNVLSTYAMPGMSSSATPYEYSHETTGGSTSAREGLLMAAPGSAWTCPQQRHQVHVRRAQARARCS